MEHGQQFRQAAYKEAGLTRPAPWALGGAPRTITLLSAVVGEMVGCLSMASKCFLGASETKAMNPSDTDMSFSSVLVAACVFAHLTLRCLPLAECVALLC